MPKDRNRKAKATPKSRTRKNEATPKRRKVDEVAEKYMKGWKAVTPYRSDEERRQDADATLPDLAALKRKYLGEDAAASAAGADATADAPDDSEEPTGLSVLEEKIPTDARVGRKAVFVDKGRVRGVQG